MENDLIYGGSDLKTQMHHKQFYLGILTYILGLIDFLLGTNLELQGSWDAE